LEAETVKCRSQEAHNICSCDDKKHMHNLDNIFLRVTI